ncbi:MAG: TIGR03862 family flavoprotein, partial [Chthoniobacterales bacterium]
MRNEIAVVGGGPAGLRAAEIAAAGGARVTVFDAKASVGRKFLVAGGGGLNLTKSEPVGQFASRYRGPEMPEEFWARRIAEFGPEDLRGWAAGLGVETFVASTGRVYPAEMKAAPLLRAWVQRLRRNGVKFAMHHRWLGWSGDALVFETPDGQREHRADATILAMGGGSWPETGSDGAWTKFLAARGVAIAPLQSANCGWEVDWPAEFLAKAEGRPLKNVVASAGNETARGELMITRYGLEGGAIYQLGAALRTMENPEIAIDFKPGLTAERLIEKLGPAKRNLLAEAKQRWRLGIGAEAILDHHADRESWATPGAMARAVKNCRVELRGPRPIAEAISSAGGVRWAELDDALMIARLPGVFVAGEMVDWEAPTGGYLMQGAFATGTHAARGA